MTLLPLLGHVHFYQSNFIDAEKYFEGTIAQQSTDVYNGLWLYLSVAHQGEDATAALKKISANYELTKWPGQVVQLYLGTQTREAVLAAAEDSDPQKSNEQHCEAYFYLGEYALLKEHKLEAVELLQKSIRTGVSTFVEFQGATAELTRLKAPTHP